MEGAKRGFARGRVWPRRLLDARRYPLSRYRRGGASSETRFTKRTAALGSIDLRTTEAFHRCAQTVCYFFSALERSPLQARRRLWCRHCPSAHAAVAPGSPRVHRARWARKPKENTAWVRVPSLRRRTAPPPGCACAVSSGPPPPAPTPKRKRRRRVRHPARLRSRDAVSRWKRFDHPVSFPRLSAPPPARHGRTPRRYSSTAALRHSCPIRHRQVLLPGEGAGLPLARVVQARAAEPQV